MMSSVRRFACVALLGMCSCTPSVLIHDGDKAFEHASQRLDHTVAYVEASGASPPERALFLQAESLYRYRFSPPPASVAAYGQRAASSLTQAITTLPVLQAFAAPLDLTDMRMRSADAATQLWEVHLRRYPCSTLRPLVLYRLGWSYRSVGINGLPRSGNTAFDELASCNCGVDPVLTNAAHEARTTVEWKSKTAAGRWSLIPGLGQFYVGETLNGAVRLATALAAISAIVLPIVVSSNRSDDLTWKRDWPLLAIGAAGIVVLSFDYSSSYEDAQRGVVRWNERKEAAFEKSHPEVP